MKKFIFVLVTMFAVTLTTYASKKDTTEIHNLRMENQRLQKYIDEYGPQSDGYSVEDISPIMQMSLETGTGEICAYGISESRNEMFAYNKAVTHATANLRKKMELYIRYGIDMYNDELETDDGSSISNKIREQVVNACKGIVEGINVIKCQKYYNRYKQMYRYEVCVKYDKENIIVNQMMAQQIVYLLKMHQSLLRNVKLQKLLLLSRNSIRKAYINLSFMQINHQK